jgi:riboflavin kinase/FMN adenylyltransferase
MRALHDLTSSTTEQPSVLSIGVFDGVHRGHQYLIRRLLESARSKGLLAGVVTFDVHPENVLSPQGRIPYMTTLDEKLALLGDLQLDFTVVLSFTTELARMSARDFVLSLTCGLGMRELWIGPDFALGRGREGDPAYLRALGRELGFSVQTPALLQHAGEVISSSRIRTLVSEGQVAEAGRLLGRHHSLTGKVVKGAHRGYELGFPTANLAVDEQRLIPLNGIYAVRVQWGVTNHQGVVNIGTRPTFEDRNMRIVEAHVLDFAGDLYERTLKLAFVERLRSERRFDSAGALVAQMNDDVARTRRLFSELEP